MSADHPAALAARPVDPLREALTACEEVLRLIHEAAGPVPKGAPMPRYSTFEAWRMAERALAPEGGRDQSCDVGATAR